MEQQSRTAPAKDESVTQSGAQHVARGYLQKRCIYCESAVCRRTRGQPGRSLMPMNASTLSHLPVIWHFEIQF